MARNVDHYAVSDSDSDEDIPIAPPLDPLNFPSVVARRRRIESSRQRSPERSTSVQLPPQIDRIRDEVNQWMMDDDFGNAGVPDAEAELVDVTGNTADAELPQHAHEDTYDIVEELLAENIEEREPTPVIEPVLPDPVADSIILTATQQDPEKAIERDYDNDVFTVDASETARISTLQDETEEICHEPEKLDLSIFQLALALWVFQNNISRRTYSQLLEVLKLLTDLADIQGLPKKKDTLKKKMTQSLPLGKLRRSTVNLDMSRLPTRSKSTEKVLTVDLEDTLSAFLSSSRISKHIYSGMAHYTNSPVRNPWEAPWWGESVRTSSGQFHCYPNGEPIFPSDFVTWKCEPGVTDHGLDSCTANCERKHLGRVVWSGLDMSDRSGDKDPAGKPLLLVQRVYQRRAFIPFQLITLTAMMSHSQCVPGSEELVIVEDSLFALYPNQVVDRLSDVYFDYRFCTKDLRNRSYPLTAAFTVRYVWNETAMQVREIKYTSPHRGELELEAFGREHIINYFAKQDMISLPLIAYLDEFGLFRNMYRSIDGVYIFPQFLDHHVRNRRSSVITATLGPYGASRTDILKTLLHTTNLDRGTQMLIDNEPRYVCAFVAAITGDMPSQQELSGSLGPTANRPCRYCLVSSEEKADLQFDIAKLGKYHYQVLHDRARIFKEVRAPTTRKTKLAGLGLSDNVELFTIVRQLFPALDIIRSRPIDAAHSEYAGISKYLLRMIFQEASSLLTRAAIKQAAEVFHHFPVPPGWPKFQSPRTHLESYSMQEHARGIIVLPIFLRCWLRDYHIKPDLHKYFQSRARDYLFQDTLPNAMNNNFSAADLVVISVHAVSQSVLTICSPNKTVAKVGKDEQFHRSIITGRSAFQYLCQVQSDTLQIKASSRASAQASKAGRREKQETNRQRNLPSYAPSIISQMQSEAAFSQQSFVAPSESLRTAPTGKHRQANAEEKINQFLRWKQLPNVHTGLHLGEVAREYGNCTMAFTLLGEDMHRQYKALIYSTNCIDAASTLVNMNNVRKTIAFLLAGSFERRLPELHAIYKNLRDRCPQLSQALDPYLGQENEDDDADNSYEEIAGDARHRKPRACLRVPHRLVAARDDPLLRIITAEDLKNNREFFAMMQEVSHKCYDTYMLDPGKSLLRWWRRVTFTTAHGNRRTFGVNNFVKASSSSSHDFSIARIDGIFSHQRTFSNNMYFCVRFAVPRSGDGEQDPILRLPYYDVTDQRAIIGLPEISDEQLWMVDLFEKGLVCVDHDVYFM